MANLREKLDEVKAGAVRVSDNLEGGADSVLPRVTASKYSWVFVFGWFMLGVATGFGISFALL